MMATSAWAIPYPWLDYWGTISVSPTAVTQNIMTLGGVYMDGSSFGLFDDSIALKPLTFDVPTFSIINGDITVTSDSHVYIKNGQDIVFSADLVNIDYVQASGTAGYVNPGYSANLENVTVSNTINSRWLDEIAFVTQESGLAAQSIFIAFNDTLLETGFGNINVNGKIAPVPEPGTFALLGAGVLGLALYHRRAKK
jgi:hypothetical protein